MIVKYSFQLLTIVILLISPIVDSASFDLFDQQSSNKLKLQDFNIDLLLLDEEDKNKSYYFEIIELIKNKKFTAAKNKINALLKAYPRKAEIYNLKALLASEKKELDLALKSYLKVIELDQKNIKAYLAMAKIFFDTGDLKQAKIYCNKAIKINDKSIYAYFLLAEIALVQKDIQNAEVLLLTAKQKIVGNGSCKKTRSSLRL